MTTTIKDLGEIELLNRLKKFMRPGQIDDDIAEIKSINKIKHHLNLMEVKECS